MIKLPDELQEVLAAQPGEPVRLVDDRTGTDYILIRAELYNRMKSALVEEIDIRDAYPLMDAVARAEGWDDPEMDSYNVYRRKT